MALHKTVETQDQAIEDVYSSGSSQHTLPKYRLPNHSTTPSAAYNLGGIVGASAAPFFAQKLVAMGGLSYVGGYVSGAAVLSLIAVLCLKETRDNDLNRVA